MRYRDLHSDPPIDLWFDDLWRETRALGEPAEGGGPIATVELAARPFDEGRLAARVELSGTTGDIEGDVWQSVRTLLQNAFLQAILPGLERRRGETVGSTTAPGGG